MTSDAGTLTVVDPVTMTARATVAVGHCPFYLDIDPVRHLAYITNEGDLTISVVDTTKVPGVSSASMASSAWAQPQRLSESPRVSANRAIDQASSLRVPLDHSVRERLARAEEDYRRDRQPGISAESIVAAFNAAARRLGTGGYEVSVDDVHRITSGAGPKLLLPTTTTPLQVPNFSPAAAVSVALTLAGEQIDRMGGTSSAQWLIVRVAAESLLADESSSASSLAHDFLSVLGVRR